MLPDVAEGGGEDEIMELWKKGLVAETSSLGLTTIVALGMFLGAGDYV